MCKNMVLSRFFLDLSHYAERGFSPFLQTKGLRHDAKKGFLPKRKQGSTVTLRKRLGVPLLSLFIYTIQVSLVFEKRNMRNLEMDVEPHAEDVVVAGIV